MALLRTSHPATPMADTDTHGIVGAEPGYPRTFVRVPQAAALDAWNESRTKELVEDVRVARDVILSNGPFLRATANGATIGGIAKARAKDGDPKGRDVDVKVQVESAPWVVVDKVELRFARSGKATPAQVTVTPKPTARGGLAADATFRIRVEEDDAFVVIARGTKPMKPVLSGDEAEESRPGR